MLRTALRNVLAHKARLAMTALAVTLGVAFVAGTLIFGDTVAQAFRNASTKNLKDVAVSVRAEALPDRPGGPDVARPSEDHHEAALTSALAERVRGLPGVTSVHPTVNGTATLAAKDGRPLNADTSWENLATNYARETDSGEDGRFPLVEGRGPVTFEEIALDRRTADAAGYRIGDTVRFAVDGPVLTKKLVGTVDTDDPRVSAGGTLALFDTHTAQQLFLRPGQFDELVVGSGQGVDDAALTERVRELLPSDRFTVTSGTQLAHDQARLVAEETKALTQMLLVFAGIALFVGIFLIANTFTMLIAQRSREIALTRAVGASRRQVVRAVLIEAGVLGLAASAVGIALGLGVAAGLRPLLNASGAGLPDGPLVVSVATVVWSLVVGVLVTILAAWLPSRRAAKIAPVEVLSSVDLAPPARSMRLRNWFGGLLTAAGVLVLLYVTTIERGTDSDLMVAMFGSALTMTGLIVLAPTVVGAPVRAMGVFTTRIFGVSGRLASQNALRNPRRTASTASALMIGMTLITALSVAGGSTQEALSKEVLQGLGADSAASTDYKVSHASYEGIDPGLGARIAQVPGVATSTPTASAPLEVRGEFAQVTGADPELLGRVVDLGFDSGALGDIGPGKVALSHTLAERTGLARGDTFEGVLDTGATRKEMTVVGVYQETRAVDEVLGTLEDVLPHAYGAKLDSVLVRAAPGEAEGALVRGIRDALGNSPLLKVQSQEQLVKEAAGQIDVMLGMLYGLLGMTVVIAVLGVINTLAMSVFERTREIGLLRAVGLERGGVRQMVRLESVLISLFGAALGIGTGIFLAWATGSLADSSLAMYETVLPWARLALFLLLALAVGVLAAVWPARRAARLNTLRAINVV